ncbi:STAS domain-containing protein [Candidatus Peregrinibacteria bacterium]|nr:STAS domain-containing protein [Candidatus Peregrinibacteria bacterium]
MKKLQITFEKINEKPNSQIVKFDGDFDGSVKENLTETYSLVDEAPQGTNLIFDFSKLNYLNSYAIGHLVSWHKTINQKGGKIFISGTNKNVEDIFAILGLATLFKVFPDVTSAIAGL